MALLSRRFRCVCLVVSVLPAGSKTAFAQKVLETFPMVVRSGLAAEAGAPDAQGLVLPDLPFSSERGYGYVGGQPQRSVEGIARGGETTWVLAWREGVEKYLFRLSRGEYLVEMTFLETDVSYPGLRVFDVLAEEKPLFARVDIAKAAGDLAWLTLTGSVSVVDGWLDLRFVPAEGKSPRVSRIRLLRDVLTQAPGTPVVEVHGGIGANLLTWRVPEPVGVTGYGVFRCDSPDGPFQTLTEEPVPTPWFDDGSATPGKEHFYKVCAYDVRGRQSAFSQPVRAAPRQVSDLGLKAYELRITADNLRMLSSRSSPSLEVPGELRYLGAVFYVSLRYDTSRRGWQRKKSFLVSLDLDRNRSFDRRRELFFSAEATDSTRLRELLSASVEASLGLAAPAVEPVALILNGRYLGLYFDIEVIDDRFRRRARLDRVGLFARKTEDDLLTRSWDPRGEQVGEGGNIWSLTELIHELNCLGEGEVGRLFEESFYLDRLLDRLALACVAGERNRGSVLNWLLRDSRNGRWEIFQDRHPGGTWGIPDGGVNSEAGPVSDKDALRWLFGSSLGHGGRGQGPSAVLESRLFNRPELRGRFLARVAALLDRDLSHEELRTQVRNAFERVRAAALEEAALWPETIGRDSFLSAPSIVEKRFAERVKALRRVLEAEASRETAPLVIDELMLLPKEGDPWVELRSASPSPVSLGDYCLAKSFRPGGSTIGPPAPGPEWIRLKDRKLQPGERVVLKLTEAETIALAASDRFLGVYRMEASGQDKQKGPLERGSRSSDLSPVDFLFMGAQTRGISYGRLAGAAARWGYLSAATPGMPNEGSVLEPPTWRFQQGLELKKSGPLEQAEDGIVPGAATVWFKTRFVGDAPEGGRPARVELRYRTEGSSQFQRIEMAYDEKAFRYSASIDPDPERRRIAYYFAAVSASGVERVYPLPAPELTFFVPVLPEVRINEVLPRPLRPATGSSGGSTGPGEFVELYNASEVPVDLEGCFLTDTKRNPTRWRIPKGSVLAAKKFLVFQADGLNVGNHTNFKLSNTGEYLGLYGRMEEGNLLIDNVAFRSMRTGESWGASPDGTRSFRAWKDPTPGARNLPKIPEEYLKKKEGEKAEPAERESERGLKGVPDREPGGDEAGEPASGT